MTEIPQAQRASPVLAFIGRVVYKALGWKCAGNTPTFRKYYARKEGGIPPEVLVPSGDIDKDFETLRRRYGPLTAKYPERKGPIVPLRRGLDDSRTQGAGDET